MLKIRNLLVNAEHFHHFNDKIVILCYNHSGMVLLNVLLKSNIKINIIYYKLEVN